MGQGQQFVDAATSADAASSPAVDFAKQAARLGLRKPSQEGIAPGQEGAADGTHSTAASTAASAKFVTPFDPVIETANGHRLPTVPVAEALKLNRLRDELEGRDPQDPPRSTIREGRDGTAHGVQDFSLLHNSHDRHVAGKTSTNGTKPDAPLDRATPTSHTNPLFPPLPMYGPPSTMRTLQCWFFRVTSAYLSLWFLIIVVLGAVFDGIPRILRHLRRRAMLQDPRKQRPFYEEEMKRQQERRAAERAWVQQHSGSQSRAGVSAGLSTPAVEKGSTPQDGEFIPTEGGPDPLVVDVAYYARRVGLDCETVEVQTEDGFIIELWHIYHPREHTSRPPGAASTRMRSPDIFQTNSEDPDYGRAQADFPHGRKKYPVLMIHGLLQSAGAFCCSDDDSLAFYLAKSGYDVWLGNNRCGFEPKHTTLKYDDPRMWAWNIRQMGVLDLAALVSRVLAETGFPKLALIAHSQGTTETFVALAKEQRPEIGEKISVFCALAPAVYAGPLIGKIYFKAMRLISPAIFRLIFGIHAFIPLMMEAHKYLPAKFYSWMGYHVFSFLFSWYDTRWDKGLRDRAFQWAPVYVSAESMRWWLGRECFAKQRCILATREEGRLEDKEDEEDDEVVRRAYIDREPHVPERRKLQRNLSSYQLLSQEHLHRPSAERRATRDKFSWYNTQFPPLALWICGADDLVDGRRLLRRFDRGREPHVRVVHKKIIEGYEHLDVIWAMDAIEKVGKEVREVIWRTADAASRRKCRVPVGCGLPLMRDPHPLRDEVPMLNSDGRRRMASISDLASNAPFYAPGTFDMPSSVGPADEDACKVHSSSLADNGIREDDDDENAPRGPSARADAELQKSDPDLLIDESTAFAARDQRRYDESVREERRERKLEHEREQQANGDNPDESLGADQLNTDESDVNGDACDPAAFIDVQEKSDPFAAR